MLNIPLILKIKKKYNFSIGYSKKILEINNWNYEKTLKFLNNINKNYIKKKMNFYFILSLEYNIKIFVIKIFFDSSIVNNSTILDCFINNIKKKKLNTKIILNEINLFFLKLKESFFIEKLIIFCLKNIFFYNHKNIIFCLLNYSNKIINLCYNIIFNKINFIKLSICKNNLLKKNDVKSNKLISNIINYNELNYSIFVNKNGFYFYYE